VAVKTICLGFNVSYELVEASNGTTSEQKKPAQTDGPSTKRKSNLTPQKQKKPALTD